MHIARSACVELLELFVEMNRCCTLVLLIACILLFCDGVIGKKFTEITPNQMHVCIVETWSLLL